LSSLVRVRAVAACYQINGMNGVFERARRRATAARGLGYSLNGVTRVHGTRRE